MHTVKNNNAIGEAVFGMDYDGIENWFCWRIRLGCSGQLATLVYEDENGEELLIITRDVKSGHEIAVPLTGSQIPSTARPVLFLPSWLQYRKKGDFFGVQTRPLGRSDRGQEYHSAHSNALKTAATMRNEGPLSEFHQHAPGIMEDVARDFDKSKLQTMRDVLVTVHNPQRQIHPSKQYHLLPAIIECRSCRAKSRIPSLRGIKQVMNGKYKRPDSATSR